MAIASLLWPVPLSGIGETRLIIASLAATLVAFLGGRMRSRADLLQVVILVPFSTLISQLIILKTNLFFTKIIARVMKILIDVGKISILFKN